MTSAIYTSLYFIHRFDIILSNIEPETILADVEKSLIESSHLFQITVLWNQKYIIDMLLSL